MGLFSFLKKSGRKEAKAAAKKEEKIAALNNIVGELDIDIQDLDIVLEEDVVTVYGQVESQEDKEKIILSLGNVEGVATVDDRISVVTPTPPAQFYEVQSGDSLSKIAKEYYGDAMKYNEIFEANKPMLSDPNKIYPGQKLRIPHLEE